MKWNYEKLTLSTSLNSSLINPEKQMMSALPHHFTVQPHNTATRRPAVALLRGPTALLSIYIHCGYQLCGHRNNNKFSGRCHKAAFTSSDLVLTRSPYLQLHYGLEAPLWFSFSPVIWIIMYRDVLNNLEMCSIRWTDYHSLSLQADSFRFLLLPLGYKVYEVCPEVHRERDSSYSFLKYLKRWQLLLVGEGL